MKTDKIQIIILVILFLGVIFIMTSCAGSKSTSATYLKDIGRPMEYPAWLKRHPIGKNAKVKRAKDLLSFQKESNKEAEKLSRFESKIQEINAKTEAIKDN